MRHSRALLLIGLSTALVAATASQAGAGKSPRQCAAGRQAVSIPAGEALLGEDGPGRPGTPTQVAAFQIDPTEVTNAQFAAFVEATGYVTQAEEQGSAAVFVQPASLPGGLDDPRGWWRMVEGASWRRPEGPGSSIEGAPDRPVVQVTFADAQAYAAWRGGALPTEREWERAARGAQRQPRDTHGWTRNPDGSPAANAWDGVFPLINTHEDGFSGLAPVGCFTANDFGLYDMVGNVWEWTRNPDGSPGPLRGGSFLCARNYCANYRPVGLQVQERDLATSHAGFRVVYPALPDVGT